jgi:hypothetical protein
VSDSVQNACVPCCAHWAGALTCAQVRQSGQCSSASLAQPSNPMAASIGGYCAVSCGRCVEGNPVCVDRAAPGGLSGKGANQQSEHNQDQQQIVKVHTSTHNHVISEFHHTLPTGGASCAQLANSGGCYQWWMTAGNYCGASCGACNGKGLPCIDMAPNGQ